jgi:intein-encoded DNA endonuclease-like protein
MKAGEKCSTIRGVIIPIDWDEKGNAVAVAISSHNEDEYYIDKDEKGGPLVAFMQEEVEVSGIVRENGNKKIITVKEYSITKNAGSKQSSSGQNHRYENLSYSLPQNRRVS